MALSEVVVAPSLATSLPRQLRQPARAALVFRFLRRNPLVMVGGLIVLGWIFVSVFAPLLTPYGPLTQRITDRLQAPSPTHWFGTDVLGRDVCTRVLYGGRISLPVGCGGGIVALVIGGVIGALAGFRAGWVDSVLMRFTDMVMAFPIIILAM